MKFFKYLLCIGLIILMPGCKDKIFSLEEKYYEKSSIIEIDKQTIEQLINDRESFAVFVYQPLCETSTNFESLLNNFTKLHHMSFYKVSFSDIKDTDLGKTIKYYPSFIIYKNGKIVDYLDASKDEDINKYKNIDEYRNWLSNYIEIGEPYKNNQEGNNEENNTSQEEIDIDIKLDNLTYDENKVNIYLFWGDGCPHCENAINFFNSIENEYGKYYKLNKFEVWYNPDNGKLLNQFASKMEEEVSVIPYIIIGNKTFKGFKEEYKQQIIDAIVSQHKNSYDVYFN